MKLPSTTSKQFSLFFYFSQLKTISSCNLKWRNCQISSCIKINGYNLKIVNYEFEQKERNKGNKTHFWLVSLESAKMVEVVGLYKDKYTKVCSNQAGKVNIFLKSNRVPAATRVRHFKGHKSKISLKSLNEYHLVNPKSWKPSHLEPV